MHLLIIGDTQSHITSASVIVKKNGGNVTHCYDVASAMQVIRGLQHVDVVMIDVVLDIAALIQCLQEEHIILPVIACGMNHDSKNAVRAIKAGAKEYIPLPPDEKLIAAVLQAIVDDQEQMVCHSPMMQQVVKLAEQIAPTEANILITGESGTGKEVIAQYIHRKSKRCERDLISLNCAAIPDNLLESELFGHEKGAFTGAAARRIGRFEQANGSTLLLDEISEMDIRLQAKLLRAIQEKEIDRVGGSQPVKIDIRVIATSNRHLQDEIKAGNFREDLYFRLNVIHLRLPPLRERKEDIQFFARDFVKKYAQLNGLEDKMISQEALQKMMAYHWPGNVRELENAMHRAVLVATSPLITADDISLAGQWESGAKLQMQDGSHDDFTTAMVGRTISEVERELIFKTLEYCTGNRTNAAKILGISIRTLRNKLNEYQQVVDA